MRERKTRLGRPTTRHGTIWLYVPKYPTGWLSPENTGLAWTTDHASPGYKAAEKLAAVRDHDYNKAAMKEKPQTVPTRDTFAECVEDRLAYLGPRITENSLHVVKSHLSNASKKFGAYRLEKITREALESYQAELQGAGLSAKSVNDRIAEIRNVLRRAVADHTLAEVPNVERVFAMRPAPGTLPKQKVKLPTTSKLDAILARVRRDLPGLADAAEIRALCGLRMQTLAFILWGQVNAGLLSIDRSQMKDHRTRTQDYVLPITDATERFFERDGAGANDLIFHDHAGNALASRRNGALSTCAGKAWRAAVDKVLGPGSGFEFAHLRNIAETRMQAAGLNDLSRNLLMGHATGIPGRYVDAAKDARRSLDAVVALVDQERQAITVEEINALVIGRKAAKAAAK
jgi:integrase